MLKSNVKDIYNSGIYLCIDERGPAVHGVQQRALPSLRCLQHPAPHAPRGHCLSRDTGSAIFNLRGNKGESCKSNCLNRIF